MPSHVSLDFLDTLEYKGVFSTLMFVDQGVQLRQIESNQKSRQRLRMTGDHLMPETHCSKRDTRTQRRQEARARTPSPATSFLSPSPIWGSKEAAKKFRYFQELKEATYQDKRQCKMGHGCRQAIVHRLMLEVCQCYSELGRLSGDTTTRRSRVWRDLFHDDSRQTVEKMCYACLM